MRYQIHTPFIHYTLHEDAILEVKYNSEVLVITRELAVEIIHQRRRVHIQDYPNRLMLHVSPCLNITPSARSYLLSAKETANIAAIAIIFTDWAIHKLAFLVDHFQRLGAAVAVFKDVQEAIAWLSKTEQNQPINKLALNEDRFTEHLSIPSKSNSVTEPKDEIALDNIRNIIDKAISDCKDTTSTTMLVAARKALTPSETPKLRLTRNERAIIDCMSAGMSTRDIANNLKKSPRTIDSQKRDLYRKMNVSNGISLLQQMNELGILNGR